MRGCGNCDGSLYAASRRGCGGCLEDNCLICGDKKGGCIECNPDFKKKCIGDDEADCDDCGECRDEHTA